MSRSPLAGTGAVLCGLLAAGLPPPAAAQSVQGIVLEQGRMDPVAGAVVTALAAGERPVASTVANADGIFLLDLPAAGTYLLRAAVGGLQSAGEPVEVAAEGDPAEVVLTVPSPLFGHAVACPEEERRPGTAVLAGIVWDPDAEIALPDAEVRIRWGGQEVRTSADGRGFYRMCAVPVGEDVEVDARLLGRVGSPTVLLLERPALAFHDVELEVSRLAGARVTSEVREGDAEPHGRVLGRLLDAASGAPVAGAVVRLEGGRDAQLLTDREGRFTFDRLDPGAYRVSVRHLGYGLSSELLEIEERMDVALDLRLAVEAIEIEGVTVTDRGRVARLDDPAARATPHRRDLAAGERLREMADRGATIEEILRESTIGVQIFMERSEGGLATSLCVQTSRRVMAIQPERAEGCQMAVVYLDDVRVPNGGQFLAHLDPNVVESIEFLPPMHATTRFGLAAGTGAVVIYTRGRGPHR